MDILDQAIAYATKMHSGQIRKMANTPYILHPMEVASIIGTMTDDREIMAAGLLHDTIEDCNADPREIRQLFGARVAALVQSETEDRSSTRSAEDTWQERKEESLIVLSMTHDIGVKILWLGDKLSNIRSFARAYRKQGDAIFQLLHQKDPKIQGWYYKSIAAGLAELKDTDAFHEYCALVKEVFGEDGMEQWN